MGYRSEVYIQCDKSIEDKLWNVLSTHDLADEYGFSKVEDNGYTVKFSAQWLKWYPGYKDVDAVTEFISEHEDNCALIAIGEDGAEVANNGCTEEYDMYTISAIEW